MKKYMMFLLMLALFIWLGCSSDDDNGVEPPPEPTVETVSATALAAAPDSVNHSTWGTVTSKALTLSLSGIAKKTGSASPAVAGNISVQAATHNKVLYMRFRWADDTLNVWYKAWEVDTVQFDQPVFFTNDPAVTLKYEDQLLVLLKGLAGSARDAWHWRSLTTALEEISPGVISGFAEDRTYSNHATTADAGEPLTVDNEPYQGFQRPIYIHQDTSAFDGFILPLAEADSVVAIPAGGWEAGHMVPGVLTDQDIDDAASRWDVKAMARNAAGEHTLVLWRPFSTGHAEDLVITSGSTIPVMVGVSDNALMVMSGGSTAQAFTPEFNLVLP